MLRIVLMTTGLLLLAACGDHKTEEAQADAAKAAAAAQPASARQKTVFDEQLKALDKAKAVEKQLQEDQKKRDKAMEDQGA
jgi:hypothetical protein